MDADDFFIVNSALHDDFDTFKAQHIDSNCSYVPINELLTFYIKHGRDHLRQHVMSRY